MTDTLAQDHTDRARALRDAALAICSQHGAIVEIAAGVRATMCDVGDFKIALITPFGGGRDFLKLPAAYNYQRASNGRPQVAQAEALLDIWFRGKKVASFEWVTGSTPTWRSFKRGAWEDDLLNAVRTPAPGVAVIKIAGTLLKHTRGLAE